MGGRRLGRLEGRCRMAMLVVELVLEALIDRMGQLQKEVLASLVRCLLEQQLRELRGMR